jgi:hypothetical protein
LDTIQPGGLAADISTFAARWGAFQGYAAGNWYFGKNADTGQQIIDVAPPASNHRVFSMSYTVNTLATLTPMRAQALAQTILPTDATQQGDLQTITDGHTTSQKAIYCSPAFAAAFPANTQAIEPLSGSGFVTVTYGLRPDGSVEMINLEPSTAPS